MIHASAINNRPSRLEWTLIPAVMGLIVLGAAFIYSATSGNESLASLRWYRQPYVTQLAWYLIGLSAAAGMCLIDYRILCRWWVPLYWLSILLLALVLVKFIGSMKLGARRWIELGPIQFQPSEFAKLAFILGLGTFLDDHANQKTLGEGRVFLKALGLLMLPFALIFKEPDLGSALVLIPVSLTMMFVAGVPMKFLRRLLVVAAVLITVVLLDVFYAPKKWQFFKLEDYQKRRLMVYFNLDFAPRDATEAERQRARVEQRDYSYNVEQALISVGSGGLTGKGWRQGTQNALGYLPRAVAHNDFIFSVIAEESGFVGSVVIITLYAVILFSGINIAGQARDRLGRLLAVGIVMLLFSHVFINIGMNIRLMPVTGIPLPLLSHGGSSVLCSLIAAGMLQNIYLHRR